MTQRLLALLMLGFAMMAPSARADKEAVKVIEALIKAHGGLDAHKKYNNRDISFEGTMTIPTDTLKMRSQVSFVLPDKSREYLELVDRKSSVEVIVNGDKFKQILDGKPKELTDEVLKAEYKQNSAINDVTQFYTLLDEKVYSIKSAKDELVNDRDTSVVMVTRVGMREIKLNIDKETSRLVRYSYKARHPLDTKKEVLQETYQSDFKDFKGLLLPTTVLLKYDGKEFMKLKVTDVKLAEKPELKAFKIDDK
jgi:hypothetical protein